MYGLYGFKCLRVRSDLAVVGDDVVVKDHGDARIKAATEDGKKICVEFGNGVTKTVATKRIRQSLSMESKGTKVVACYLTKEYRQMATDYVFPDDRVLEIGCHEGITTDIIAKRCGYNVIGVDKSALVIDDASKRFPKVRFKAMDALNMESMLSMTKQFMAERTAKSQSDKSSSATTSTTTTTAQIQNASTAATAATPAPDMTEMPDASAASASAAIAKAGSTVGPAEPSAGAKRRSSSLSGGKGAPLDKKAKLELQYAWTKIFIDIGGNAPLPKVIECVSKVDAAFKPHLIVVKSKLFRNLMNKTSVFGLQSDFEKPRRTRNSE